MRVTTILMVCLVVIVVGEERIEDISGCCTHLRIETGGPAGEHQSNRLGDYRVTGVVNDRPIYKNEESDEFLFYLQSKNKGLWMVGPQAGQFNGGLAHRGDKFCVEDVVKNQWKYTDGSAWNVDPRLRVSCLDPTVTTQCVYSDMTEFDGGDLPQAFGGGGVETNPESSADCIKECQKRAGCKYWTYVMGEKVNCFLKNNKGDEVRRAKHVSGSIPQACLSTPPSPTQAPATFSSCTFPGLEFQGGELFPVTADSVSDCRRQCGAHVSCRLFTFLPDETLNSCLFFTDQARPIQNVGAVSGALEDNCQTFVLPPVETSDQEETTENTFNENEVNGRFKITSSKWNPTLSDPTSPAFSELANTIEDSLEEMLRNDLGEQAEFTVKVQKFRQGSVVCDFKVNYVLKEAYIAIPFAIKPSNITGSLGNNFKFKKGILFQRFLIAANSFNASAPVDHCSLKGCSHKCDYDYDLEDYVCTCPRSLVLDNEGLKCLTEEEAANQDNLEEEKNGNETKDEAKEGVKEDEEDVMKKEEEEDVMKAIETVRESTDRPPIELVVLPMNCLWGPWSGWSGCSTSCGLGTRQRERTILMPAKNGGKCPGAPKEFVACESLPCEEFTEETATEQVLSGDDDTEVSTDDKEDPTDDKEDPTDDKEDPTDDETDAESVGSVTENPALEDYDDSELEVVTKITVSKTVNEITSKDSGNEVEAPVTDGTIVSVDTTLPYNASEDTMTEDSKETVTVLSEESTPESYEELTTESSEEISMDSSEEMTTESSVTVTNSFKEATSPTLSSQDTTSSYIDSEETTTLGVSFEKTTTSPDITSKESTVSNVDPGETLFPGISSEEFTTDAIQPELVEETTVSALSSDDTTIMNINIVTVESEEVTEAYIEDDEDEKSIESFITTEVNAVPQTTTVKSLEEIDTKIVFPISDEDEISTLSPAVIAMTTLGEILDDDIDAEILEVEFPTDSPLPSIDAPEEVTDDLVDIPLETTTVLPSQVGEVEEHTEEGSGVILGVTTFLPVTTPEAEFPDFLFCTTKEECSKEKVKEITDSYLVDTETESDIYTTTEKVEEIGEETSEPETPNSVTFMDDIISVTQSPVDTGDVTTTIGSLMRPTTVSVISVEEDGDDITITTTVRPSVKEESDEEIEEKQTTTDIGTTPSYYDSNYDDLSAITISVTERTDETPTGTTTGQDNDQEMETVTEDREVEKTTESETEIDDTTSADDSIITTASATIVEDDETKTTTHIYDDLDNKVTEIHVDVVTESVPSESDKKGIDVTTVPTETVGGDHEFSCKEIEESTLDTNPDTQIPMECVLTNVKEDKVRTVFIVLSKDSVDPDRLFAKNVKVVVKDFMIMDLSPK